MTQKITISKRGNADDGYAVFAGDQRIGYVASNRQWGGSCWSFFSDDNDNGALDYMNDNCDYDNLAHARKQIQSDYDDAVAKFAPTTTVEVPEPVMDWHYRKDAPRNRQYDITINGVVSGHIGSSEPVYMPGKGLQNSYYFHLCDDLPDHHNHPLRELYAQARPYRCHSAIVTAARRMVASKRFRKEWADYYTAHANKGVL